MDIYILSSGRATKQTTYINLPPSIQRRLKIVVPPDELLRYRGHGLPAITDKAVVLHSGKVRQWIIEQAPTDKVAILDDDLVFGTRRKDQPTLFHNATPADLEKMFSDIEAQLDNYAHVGVATREGANYDTEDYKYVTRMIRVLCYRTDIYLQQGIRFDRINLKVDFDVTLQLLRQGYPNCVLNYMVQNQNGSNAVGGCAQYRTDEMMVKTSHELAALHPGYVQVVQKKTRTAWEGKERTDVKIFWKRAYNGK